MAQQFDCPKTETELRTLLDELYQQSRKARQGGKYPAFKGLLEIMSAETTIVTAIHNIKSNHGSDTPVSITRPCGGNICKNPTDGLLTTSRELLKNLKHRKYAGNILTNREKGKASR